MPILSAHAFEFFSKSPEQTRRLGMRIGALLRPGDLVCLQGDLGAGKTTLVQGAAQGWGSVDDATSPTFVLVNTYRRADDGQFFHLDAYRIDSLAEAEELDLDTLLAQGPLVAEWPERMEAILPQERLWIYFDYESDEHRTIRLTGCGSRPEALLDTLRATLFGAN